MKSSQVLKFTFAFILLVMVFASEGMPSVKSDSTVLGPAASLNIPLGVMAIQAVVEADVLVEITEYDSSENKIFLRAEFDYRNVDGLLRDFDASSKEEVSNFLYSWEGSGDCWDTSLFSFQCDGIITRLIVSYDYSQTIDGETFEVGAGINVPDATINGYIEMVYPSAIYFSYSRLQEPKTHNLGYLQWDGSEDGAYGAFVGFTTEQCDSFEDTDGDSLYDGWEICGYDHDNDAIVDVNLPEMGADPYHKDLFVEIDYMLGPNGELDMFRPSDSALIIIVESFKEAPVPSNDSDPNNGETGINLHIDIGSENPNLGLPLAHSRSNRVMYSEYAGTCLSDSFQWNKFEDYQTGNFDLERLPIFHYGIWGNLICQSEGTLGFAKQSMDGEPGGAVFVIGIGEITNSSRNLWLQSGIFMHEFGHNLGLKHGGNDDVNFKPNYLSVMNYSYSMGIPIDGVIEFDYSGSVSDPLNEEELSEIEGIIVNSDEPKLFGVIWLCRERLDSAISSDDFYLDLNSENVNWNCNNNNEEVNVQANINGDSLLGTDQLLGNKYSTLEGHDDWGNIVFTGGGVIGALDAIQLPLLDDETEIDEPTFELVEALPDIFYIFLPLTSNK